MHAITICRAARPIALAAGLFAILIAAPAWSQEHGPQQDPEEHLAKLQEELNLTDPQVEQVRAIITEQHAKFAQLHEETHARITDVLTEEQRSRLEEIHAEHQEVHGERGHGSGHEGGAP